MTISEARPPGRPRARPVEEERRLILEAGLAEFAAKGPDGASVDSVARAAGVHRPNIYGHFGNRGGLTDSVIDFAAERLESVVLEGLAANGLDTWQDIARSGFRAMLDLARDHGDVLRLMWQLPRADSGRVHARQAVLDNLASLLDDRLDPTDAAVNTAALAVMLYGMAEAVALHRDDKGWDDEELLELLTTFTAGGIAALLRDD